MVFITIAKPHHQDAPDSCTPTCVKVILDTQFNINKGVGCIKKWLNYRLGCGSCSPYNTPIRLESHLDGIGIVPIEHKNANYNILKELLSKNILPIIFLKIEYLNEAGVKNIKVYDGGEDWWHCVVVCGVDEKKESIFIYDPYLNYSGKLTEKNCQVKIDYALLTKYWKTTNNRLYGLVHKKGASKKEKNSTLTQFKEVKG